MASLLCCATPYNLFKSLVCLYVDCSHMRIVAVLIFSYGSIASMMAFFSGTLSNNELFICSLQSVLSVFVCLSGCLFYLRPTFVIALIP